MLIRKALPKGGAFLFFTDGQEMQIYLRSAMKPLVAFARFSLVLCAAMACNKDEENNETPNAVSGPQQVLDPTVITETDNNGVTVGAPDPDDWTTDEEFNAMELSFFSETPAMALLPGSSNNSVHLWANPVQSGIAHLRIQSPLVLRTVKLVYVDRFASVLGTTQFTNSQEVLSVQLDLLSVGGLQNEEFYRLYYRALSADSTVLVQGHGDFRMNN